MTYIIGEVGQNHSGSMEMARGLIDMAADPRPYDMKEGPTYPCDAVKFTKRDLEYECTASMMASRYENEHAFGDTYGAHRAALEFSDAQHYELYKYAKDRGLDFVETICHPNCLSLLDLFQPDRIKIASRDLTNMPLLEAVAATGIPLILSTGMASKDDLHTALETVAGGFHYPKDKRPTLLHCVSSYPAKFEDLNLSRLLALRGYDYHFGYSDHSQGIAAPIAAVALGATVIEKHITLSRTMRGTDQAGSLERDGLWRMNRDIRNIEAALGEPVIREHPAASAAKAKLERSIATTADLPAGTVLTESDITLLSPGGGYLWRDRHKVIGHTLTEGLPRHEIIWEDEVA